MQKFYDLLEALTSLKINIIVRKSTNEQRKIKKSKIEVQVNLILLYNPLKIPTKKIALNRVIKISLIPFGQMSNRSSIHIND